MQLKYIFKVRHLVVKPMPIKTPHPLLAFGFRPFFLLAAVYAALSVAIWAGALLDLPFSPLPALGSSWHAHEMLYGFVPAAIAGFLLTAITNWTGAPPLAGRGLAALAGLWLAGRAAMWFWGLAPAWLVILVDGAFLPVLAVYITRVLLRAGNRRNLGLVAVLATLACGNFLMHAGVLTGNASLTLAGRDLGLDLITVLMAVIAGRITPAFTANWLRAQGRDITTGAWPWLAPLAIGSIAVLAVAHLVALPGAVTGALALLAAVTNGLRLASWAGWRARREPLLWILHLGYGCIVLALLGRSFYLLGWVVSPSLWYHALGVGAMGILVLGVMTRVTVGHTGRPLRLLPGGLWIYLAVIIATAARLGLAAGVIPYAIGVAISATAWSAGFLLFVIIYSPLLTSPRPDGRPG